MKKKLLLIASMVMLFACVLVLSASAASVEYDGITYSTSGTNATVSGYQKIEEADIVIPSTFTVNNATYTVTAIGDSAFRGNSFIQTVVVPETVTSVASHAFRECSNLETVEFKGEISAFYNAAFYNDGKLTSVTLAKPESFTKVGEHVFYNCKVLTDFDMPSTVTEIGPQAFMFCSAYAEEINLTLKSLGGESFQGSGITKLTLSGTFTSIPKNTFYGANSLQSVDLSGATSLTTIGENGFRDSYALTSVKLPSSITAIESRGFEYNALTSIELPYGLVTIGSYAFRGSDFETLIIPDTVTSIGGQAFNGCPNLTTVKLSNNLETLGENNFQGCTKITKIVFPATLTSVSKHIFHGSGIQTLVIANETVSGYTNNILESTSIKAVFYAGSDPSVLKAQITALANADTVTYAQHLLNLENPEFTGYTKATVIYGTQNCASCSDVVVPTLNLVFTDYASPFSEQTGCDSCGAKTVVKTYEPILTSLGYAAKIGGNRVTVGYSINQNSLEVLKSYSSELVLTAGVVAYAPDAGETSADPINDDLSLKDEEYTIYAVIDIEEYASFNFILNGFGAESYGVALVMCAFVNDGAETSYVCWKNVDGESVYGQYDSAYAFTFEGVAG